VRNYFPTDEGIVTLKEVKREGEGSELFFHARRQILYLNVDDNWLIKEVND